MEEVFASQEHLKRRTRGIRLLPLKPDGTYRRFLQQIWPYQFTAATAPLTEKLANKLFDFSGGIPAYIIKIFKESQAQAILYGKKCIDERIMQRTIDILAIKIPKTYSGGTYLSDFEVEIESDEDDSYPSYSASALETATPRTSARSAKPAMSTGLEVLKEQIDQTEPAKPIKPKKTKKPKKPARTDISRKSTKSAKTKEPVKPSRSVEPIEPVQKAEPVIPEKRIEPSKQEPVEPTKPIEPIEPIEPAQPATPPEAVVLPKQLTFPVDTRSVPRLYANQRGRKAIERDDLDMAEAFQPGCDMAVFLREHNLLKEW